MREIPLTRGRVALVDDEDYALVSAFSWYVGGSGGNRTFYADHKSRKHGRLSMHRLILDAPVGVLVDHVDGDGLNNQRANLRFATASQNQFNRRARRGGSSRFKGVHLNRRTGKWVVSLGGFATEEEAAAAYDLIAPLAHGEFAVLNERAA